MALTADNLSTLPDDSSEGIRQFLLRKLSEDHARLVTHELCQLKGTNLRDYTDEEIQRVASVASGGNYRLETKISTGLFHFHDGEAWTATATSSVAGDPSTVAPLATSNHNTIETSSVDDKSSKVSALDNSSLHDREQIGGNIGRALDDHDWFVVPSAPVRGCIGEAPTVGPSHPLGKVIKARYEQACQDCGSSIQVNDMIAKTDLGWCHENCATRLARPTTQSTETEPTSQPIAGREDPRNRRASPPQDSPSFTSPNSDTLWRIKAKYEQACQQCGKPISIGSMIVKREVGWCHDVGNCWTAAPEASPMRPAGAPDCHLRGAKMVARVNRNTSERFWGCSQFGKTKCRGSLSM